jgi:hypothetical protein
MPNYCSNVVIFRHSDTAAILRVSDAFASGNFMTSFFPCPEELKDTTSGFFSDTARQAELEQKQAANIVKHGYPTWYEWMLAELGTKWDVGQEGFDCGYTHGDTELTLTFDSAWSPPCEFYAKMCDQFGYDIKAYYYEPGMAFCGIWDNGEDVSFKVPGNSEDVSDIIPAKLDELFGITEQMREYEQENS